MTNPSDPAFNPLPGSPCPGLTKREYFAAMAMQGMLANPNEHRQYPELFDYATKAIVMADALIDELNKEAQ